MCGKAPNRRLARSIVDGGFHEFRRQLEYKAAIYGATVVLADRWYPSSRTCSRLAVRSRPDWRFRSGCSVATNAAWRSTDLNAAKNLDPVPDPGGAGFPAASSAVSACREACFGATAARSWVGTGRVKQAPVKQEPNGSVPLDLDPGGQAAQLQAEIAS